MGAFSYIRAPPLIQYKRKGGHMKASREKTPRNTRGHTFFEKLRHSVTHGLPKRTKGPHRTTEDDRLPGCFSPKDGGIAAHRILTEEGVAVLEWRAFFALPPEPSISKSKTNRGMARIRAFYIGIAREISRFAEEKLFPAQVRAYQENPDTHKRFRYARLILSVDCREMPWGNGLILFSRHITLSRGGKRLFETVEEDLFSQKSGKMLPKPRHKKENTHQKKAAKARPLHQRDRK